jgi:hypothetical protein
MILPKTLLIDCTILGEAYHILFAHSNKTHQNLLDVFDNFIATWKVLAEDLNLLQQEQLKYFQQLKRFEIINGLDSINWPEELTKLQQKYQEEIINEIKPYGQNFLATSKGQEDQKQEQPQTSTDNKENNSENQNPLPSNQENDLQPMEMDEDLPLPTTNLTQHNAQAYFF